MERQEKRVSRVERNSRRYKSYKNKNKRLNDNKIVSINDYQTDDGAINTVPTRVRRSERNKRGILSRTFFRKIKNKEDKVLTKKDTHMKVAALVSIIIGLLAIWGGVTLFFRNHFYLGTEINCLNVSGKSVDDVENEFKINMADYSLELDGRDNSFSEIKGENIDLVYDESKKNEIEEIKSEQNKSSWIKSVFTKKENGVSESSTYTSQILSYNYDKLNKLIDDLSIIKDSTISDPKSAYLKYDGKSFIIEKEVQGNRLNKDKLLKEIAKSISSGQSKLDLEKADCYEKPKYTSSSKEILSAQNKLNQYKDFKLTYKVGTNNEEISGDKLMELFEFDDNYNATLSNAKVNEYVDNLCKKYNTYGTSHNFTTTDGNTITVYGGDYGYEINKDEEFNKLLEDIEGKKPVSREPIYSKTALGDVTNDIGNSYVEINMSKQHLWFYKDGALIVQGDVVTGNVSNGTATPEGTYSLKYKQKDSVLVGEGYRSPVSFWMPFNNNIGIHDASWRSVFGGRIYLSSGSHGCVNAPYKVAQAIYSNIEPGMPVICYN